MSRAGALLAIAVAIAGRVRAAPDTSAPDAAARPSAGVAAAAPAGGAAPAATAAPAAAMLGEVDRRWRVEIDGQPIGWSRLLVRCDRDACDASWESAFRPPEPADAIVRRRLLSRTRLDGRALWVRAEADEAAPLHAGAGPVPASLAELLLSHAAEGERRCLDVRDEASGETGRACAARRGEWLEGEVLGVALRFRARPGAAAEEVEVPAQRARFVADARASLPARAPRLLESEVALGPGVVADGASAGEAADVLARGASAGEAVDRGLPDGVRFCGREPEPASDPRAARRLQGRTVASEWPDGASCREKTARWVERGRAAGLVARHVVGVAWDGRGFVWHEWAEARVDRRWIAVDPSFRQLPAEGPRFALARFDDAPSRQAAGRAILACWGKRVERERSPRERSAR